MAPRRKGKRPARRSARRTGGSARRRRSSGRRWLRWLAGLALLGVLVVGIHLLHLSREVRVKFEGKRWAVPARVFARPMELYVGARIDAARLQAELERLGYRRVKHPREPAQWSRAGGRFLFRTRPFLFWDGAEPARAVEVRLGADGVERLRDAVSGRELDLVRLEPPVIGSIYPAHREDRVLVRREELPDHLVAALLAVEDRHFFEHHGIDLRGIARALVANLRAGRAVQGGSTLTQQLVKNFFLTPERSLKRKIDEALMALIVEARYDKDEILEAYANEVYLGQDGERAIHGFGLAARFYFNRPLQELELHETALLVALLKGASWYNPRQHPERALERRNLVLDLMARQGFITAGEAARARKRPLGVVKGRGAAGGRHPAFLDLVRRQLRRDYREEDLTSEGLRIFTTLDPWVQSRLEGAVAEGLAAIEKQRKMKPGTLEAAAVVVAPQEGEVRALAGGRRAGYAGFNRALDAVRPVGSLIKPVVYLLALSQPQRYTLVTLLEDRPLALKDGRGRIWKPRNYDRKAHGLVPLHTALARSYNLATVRLGLELGVERVVRLLRRMGVSRPLEAVPALLLGAVSLTPLEVAQLYQVFASGGFRSPLRAIREVTDARGQPLQRYPVEVEPVADPGPVYLLVRNLVEVTREGTGRGVRRYLPADLEVAGKTGTTNELRDSWFAGFSGDWLAVVWVGRDDNRPAGLTGASGALPVWGRLMKRLDPLPLQRVPPEGVVYVWVDPDSGRRSAEGCPGAVAMPFIHGSEPQLLDECAAARAREADDPLGDFLDRLFR